MNFLPKIEEKEGYIEDEGNFKILSKKIMKGRNVMDKIDFMPLTDQGKIKQGIKRPNQRHRKIRVSKKKTKLIQYVNKDTMSINMLVGIFIIILTVMVALVIMFK